MARLLAKAKEVREALYPVLQQSAFAERGVLTPTNLSRLAMNSWASVPRGPGRAATLLVGKTTCRLINNT